jgi:lipid A 3-O-deacylase
MKRFSLIACSFAVFSLIAGAASPARDAAAGGPARYEGRLGILGHDVVLEDTRKESGADLNIEILFPAPRTRFLEAIWSPRPHAGASINIRGGTSQLYGGLTWMLWRPGNLFLSAGFGFSVHDGKLDPDGTDDREALGTRVLFRESVELGYWLFPRHGVSFHLDHVSNSGLSDDNDGLTNVGLRYLHRF